MEQLKGTGVALVTPFTAEGTIDIHALSQLVEHCKKGKVDYLVALGTTAESATLTTQEKQTVLDTIVVANNGDLPLVIGVGGNNTAAVLSELKTYDFTDFCAILSVSPFYNKPTQEGIYQHFSAIANASPVPVIVYNVPSRTGSNMAVETTLRLAKDCANIVAIKEASGDMTQILSLLKSKPKDFLVLSGDDNTSLLTLLAGGEGVISVLGQGVPHEFSEMVRLGMAGKTKQAFDIHYMLQDGMHYIFEEGNPAGIKTLLHSIGIGSTFVRLPLVTTSDALRKKINLFMYSLSRIPA